MFFNKRKRKQSAKPQPSVVARLTASGIGLATWISKDDCWVKIGEMQNPKSVRSGFNISNIGEFVEALSITANFLSHQSFLPNSLRNELATWGELLEAAVLSYEKFENTASCVINGEFRQ